MRLSCKVKAWPPIDRKHQATPAAGEAALCSCRCFSSSCTVRSVVTILCVSTRTMLMTIILSSVLKQQAGIVVMVSGTHHILPMPGRLRPKDLVSSCHKHTSTQCTSPVVRQLGKGQCFAVLPSACEHVRIQEVCLGTCLTSLVNASDARRHVHQASHADYTA